MIRGGCLGPWVSESLDGAGAQPVRINQLNDRISESYLIGTYSRPHSGRLTREALKTSASGLVVHGATPRPSIAAASQVLEDVISI